MKEKLIVALLIILFILVFIAMAYLTVAVVRWDIGWISSADPDFRFLFILCVIIPIILLLCYLGS